MTTKPQVATVAILLKKVPRGLRDAFKSWCALRGLNMTEVLIQHMRDKIQIPKE